MKMNCPQIGEATSLPYTETAWDTKVTPSLLPLGSVQTALFKDLSGII